MIKSAIARTCKCSNIFNLTLYCTFFTLPLCVPHHLFPSFSPPLRVPPFDFEFPSLFSFPFSFSLSFLFSSLLRPRWFSLNHQSESVFLWFRHRLVSLLFLFLQKRRNCNWNLLSLVPLLSLEHVLGWGGICQEARSGSRRTKRRSFGRNKRMERD